MKVSMVSASRRAGPPHCGQVVCMKVSLVVSGDSPAPVNLHILRQQHRQLIVRHRHDAAFLAIEHRDRRAPVALAADAPVAQAVVDGALPDAARLHHPRRSSPSPRRSACR